MNDLYSQTETETPVEVIQSLQEPAKPAPDQTALAIRESMNKVQGALTEFDAVSAGLADLQKRFGNVVFPVATTVGMREAVAARGEIRKPRYATEQLRKAAKAPVLALGKDIDARAAWIETQLLKLEEPIDEQIKVHETRVAAEKEAKRTAEANRVAAHQKRIDDIKQVALNAAGEPVSHMDSAITALAALQIGAECEEFEAPTRNAQTETLERLRSMRATQAKRDEEAAELARLRAESEQRAAQEAAAQAQFRREEAERLKAEAKALADARAAQEAEFAKRKAEQDRLEAEAQARRRAEDAAAQQERAEMQAKLDAERREMAEFQEAKRIMREVEEAQARAAAAERQRKEDEEAAKRAMIEQEAKEEAGRQILARMAADETRRAASAQMLAALRAVHDWDMEPNALPEALALQVVQAILAAEPPKPEAAPQKRKGKA